MILIIGGAYQGKLEYALERFGLTQTDVFKCSDLNTAVPGQKKIIYEIDKWVLAMLKSNIEETDFTGKFVPSNLDTIVICNDISCGIVPVDPIMRKWRESVGRFFAALSRDSDEVIRLFCGIPLRIK